MQNHLKDVKLIQYMITTILYMQRIIRVKDICSIWRDKIRSYILETDAYIWNLIRSDVRIWVEEYVTVHYDSRISLLMCKVTDMSESQEIKEIKRVYAGLETLYHIYFPKSDPSLIHDLLWRLKKIPPCHRYIWLKCSQNQV